MERLGRRLLAEEGAPDHLVCAAGVNPLVSGTAAVDERFYDAVLDVNLKGMFATCRAFLPAMAARGGGSAVLVASVSGLVGWGGSSVYAASKGAAIALTRALAAEQASAGLRVNCVCPGSVRTAMVLDNLAARGDVEAGLAATAAEHPLGRIGEPQDVAAAVLYLLGDGASFVTGSALVVDGGLTAI